MASILALMKNGSPNDMANPNRAMRDSLVEFLATAVFVNAGTLAAVSTGRKLSDEGINGDVARILPIAVSFGVSILALAYSIGHITGGHMNPGVSLLMFFKGKMSVVKMLLYWVAQFVGALLGAAITWGCTSGLTGDPDVLRGNGEMIARPPFTLGSTTLDPALTVGNGLLLEFMGSFFFYMVIAQTACDERGIAASMFPAIPIGLVLVVVHICLIPFTGCGVNPARTFGPSMITCIASSEHCQLVADSWYWIYYIGPFLASFAVAEVTEWMSWDVDGTSTADSGNNQGDQEKEKSVEATTPDVKPADPEVVAAEEGLAKQPEEQAKPAEKAADDDKKPADKPAGDAKKDAAAEVPEAADEPPVPAAEPSEPAQDV